MCYKILKTITEVVLLFLFAGILLFQRITVLDILDTNSWDLYVHTILCALLQYVIAIIQYKWMIHRPFLFLYKIVFIIAACWSAYLLVPFRGTDGLVIVCFLCDIFGIYLADRFNKKAKGNVCDSTESIGDSGLADGVQKTIDGWKTQSVKERIKQILGVILQVLLLIALVVLWFYQEMVSSDIYYTNVWELYFIRVLVIVFALLQYLVLFIQYKTTTHRIFLTISNIVYIMVTCWSLFALILTYKNIFRLVAMLPTVGALCLSYYLKKKAKKKTWDGLREP